MPEITRIAKELTKGNIEEASALAEDFSSRATYVDKLEVMEIAKQSMVGHLKKGNIKDAKRIADHFLESQDLIDDVVEQAILSSMYDNDAAQVRALRKGLPLSRALEKRIIAYCDSYEKESFGDRLKEVFA